MQLGKVERGAVMLQYLYVSPYCSYTSLSVSEGNDRLQRK